MSVHVYYSDLRNLGLLISEFVILNYDKYQLKETIRTKYNISRNTICNNEHYYINKLNFLDFFNIEIDNPLLEYSIGDDLYYLSLNPSIIKTDYGYLVNVRFVNYKQRGVIKWNYMEIYGKVKTKNFLIKYNINFEILDCKEIIYSDPDRSYEIEDIILFEHNGNLLFSCSKWNNNPCRRILQRLCKLIENDEHYTLEYIKTLKRLNEFKKHHKNWIYIPYNNDEDVHFLYYPSFNC